MRAADPGESAAEGNHSRQEQRLEEIGGVYRAE